ncbi:helix-turn-helix transcriptional regulator [Kiloniella majae]|uniref:helix-turn-helix transcriptional regulator n=1 Tax=Kiloniella majae TaxID=1938558 RepID=UPI000A277F1C|nr:hypothetical protein [Kiloniella majae]
MKELKFAQDILQAETPGETRDLILNLGFNGLFFQRWYPDVMDNWEGLLARGFQEHYYAAQVYRFCPVARAIHQWHRSYTFAEARRTILVGSAEAKVADNLWKLFGMEDGVVVFSGRSNLKSALILTTDCPVEELYQKHSGILALAADKLDRQLCPGHTLLRQLSRENITLSPIQQKILRLQINQPELSNAAMAEMLGISVNTLFSHHKKIAKKEGVTTFTGAIIKQLGKNASD